jgi:hypothetical protein
MYGSDPSSQLDPPGPVGELHRLWPLRVLVVSPDQRFRAVSSMLVARRGCAAFTSPDSDSLVELIGRERIDVLVVEGDGEWAEVCAASASAVGFAPPAGVVEVAEEPGEPAGRRPLLAKWGPFEQLFAAVEQVDLRRAAQRGGDASIWPPAAGREHGAG